MERRLQEIEDEMRSGQQVVSERYHREKTKSMSGELQEVEHYTNAYCYLFANILKGPYHYTSHFPGYSELNEVDVL